ncbi:MAG: transcriptional repressor [Coriobacteriaceae bacterium]|uniref:Fur family transcriptional regulator n=1 Tax=Tractidigestivibacter sp. TaxID=2847320 RepID=UPI002A916353|nr:transcriptional repressor [Tractidigestivibacter sp.]MCI6273515.1 transcriptional repressor [Coriobacteriaceae bacterium]MCI7437989.1 transcriptional repressor [Coriobacteriaceae bacterium]MDY5270922.1 transcriptional repressor [Tractidigestivibacter sp.]
MATRGTYNTRQRQAILDYLDVHTDRYASVDCVFEALRSQGVEIGRSTIYRTLETLAGEGMASKVVAPRGEVALYRLVNRDEENAGQLVCVECGRVSTIDCAAFQEFSHHVSTEHGFAIDLSRTVLYGRCPLCAQGKVAAHA